MCPPRYDHTGCMATHILGTCGVELHIAGNEKISPEGWIHLGSLAVSKKMNLGKVG